MTRFKIVCGATLVLVFLLLGVVATTPSASPVSPKLPPHGPGTTNFSVSQSNLSGVPAIPVHTTTGVTANDASPAFTENDVVAYLNKEGFPAGPLVQGASLKILAFQFVPANQASALMKGEFIGRPDDALVCYVKVQGPFMLTYAHLPAGDTQTTADIGDIVFDAHTGNLLAWGFY